MDEENVGRRLDGRYRDGRAGGRRAAPAAERCVGERACLGESDVARDDEQRSTRAQPRRGELHDVVPGDALQGFLRGAPPVGILAVDLCVEEAPRDGAGLRQLERERRERARAGELQLVARVSSAPAHVAEQLEGEVGVVAQDVGREREEIVPGARAEGAASTLDLRRDLLRRPGRGPFSEQLRHEAGQPFLARRRGRFPGAEAERDGQHRLLMVLHHHQRRPVRQHHLLEGRELHGSQPGGPRRVRGEGVLRSQAAQGVGGQDRGHAHDSRQAASPLRRLHCAPPWLGVPAGFTMTTTALAGSRYLSATRRISSPVTAR